MAKKEALSVSRLINEVLVDQLGVPIKQIVNDTPFSKYTSIKRPDILISNAEYDLAADNQDEYIKNLVCYVEAKSVSCKVDDADWKDGISQGMTKAPMLNIPFFGVTNCKTTYFYNANTGDKLTVNGNLISEFQTLDIFRIIKRLLKASPTENDIKIGSGALTSVSEAVFNKKLWELANEYRAIDFENNTQKIDFTIGMIALEYYEEKAIIDSTYNASLSYWSDGRSASNEKDLVSRITSYIDWLAVDPDFQEFSSLIKKVKSLINGTRPTVNPSSFSSIYSIIDSMHPLHGTGFDLFGAVYERFANSKEKKDFGEYFTRRQYSHVFAELLLKDERVFNAKNKVTIIDPFCGTGGMLTESFKVLREHYKDSGSYNPNAEKHLSEDCFYGIDIRSENISRTRLNMFLVGDGHTNMHSDNSLIPETQHGKKLINNEYRYCITNPPYGAGTIAAATDVVGSKRMEIAAIYRVLDLLETGGRACVITPDGILENPSLEKVRDELLRTCEIEAIISLPKFAFAPYTKEKTYALFLKKLHDRPSSTKDNKSLPTGKYQKTKIWMYIIDNDGFANSDKRFPTRLRDETEKWLHDELQSYVDDDGNENLSILEQRWKSFDDGPNGTEWITEKGDVITDRKGGFIDPKNIAANKYKILLPETYLRTQKPHYIDEADVIKAIKEIDKKAVAIKAKALSPSTKSSPVFSNIPINEIVDCMSGNSGLTEELIYHNLPDKDAIEVLSAATTSEKHLGFISRNARINNNPIKITPKKEGLLVIRKGKAGLTKYLPKGEYTINDDAYILYIKDDCPYEVDLRWLSIRYKDVFLQYASSSANGTWNKTGFMQEVAVDIPDIKEQLHLVDIYEELYKRERILEEAQAMIASIKDANVV